MICPECGSEYREGFYTCADCEVPLVEGEAAEIDWSELPEVGLVTVLSSSGPADLAMAESLLRSSGIRYVKSGEGLQGLLGMGALGTGFDVAVGPVALQVAEVDAEAARELLSALSRDPEEPAPLA